MAYESFREMFENGMFPVPLTDSEIRNYLQCAREGDESARDKLIEHNLAFILYLINKYIYYKNGDELEDLMSVGVLGLIKAVDLFDISKQTRFNSYAATIIINTLYDSLPKKKDIKTISINTPLNNSDNKQQLTIGDKLYEEDNSISIIEKVAIKETVKKALLTLSDKEKTVIEMRYGFTCEPMTQKIVGIKLGTSSSYIGQIEKRALKKIARVLHGSSIIEFVPKEKTKEAHPKLTDEVRQILMDDCSPVNIESEIAAYSMNQIPKNDRQDFTYQIQSNIAPQKVNKKV